MSHVESASVFGSSVETATVDSLLEDLGGCGLFQVLAAFLLHGSIMAAAWSTMFMAYGNYNPGWTCADEDFLNSFNATWNNTGTSVPDDTTSAGNGTASCDVYQRCKNVVFNDDSSTIVTQWNLACDKAWVTSLMISLEMVGILVGVTAEGHLSFYFGRKVNLYGTLVVHASLNLIAMFSVNWPMYTAIRFLLGATTGSLYLGAYVYPLEFITSNWRGVVAALPASNSGNLSFAVAAMLLRDWKLLHLATVIFTLLWLLPVFWVPESLRWLAVKGKVSQATKVVTKIARVNRTKKMPNTCVISSVAVYEREKENSKSLYNFFDLYRNGLLARTIIFSFAWLNSTFVYYVIVYGISSLSGHFYANLMIFSFITTASYPFVPLLSNTVGRRLGIILFLVLCVVCCAGLVAVRFITEYVNEGLAINTLSLCLLTCVEGAWTLITLHSVELYPTVLRSVAYSHASSVGRIGGMLAPFMIADDQRSSYVTYLVMGVVTLVTCILLHFLPETKGRHMTESVTLDKQDKDKEDKEEEKFMA